MRLSPLSLLLLALSAFELVTAQQLTTTVIDDDGDTIVERISTNAGGDAVQTRVLSTLTVNPNAVPPIVGAPGTATGVATIVFYYTSQGVEYTATFTPSYQSPSPTPTPSSGTIIATGDWTYTEPVPVATGVSSAEDGVRVARGWRSWIGMGAGVALGVVGGAWAVL